MMTGGQMETTINVELFGTDPRVQRTIVEAQNLSVSRASVLICGENGVGKRTLGKFLVRTGTRF